jgi:hypothetical protein
MTEAEAKAKAMADGILEEQITPQILAFYGYVTELPTQGLVVGPVILPDTVKADILALQEEAKKNSLPSMIVTQLKSVLGFVAQISGKAIIPLVLVTVLLGCGESTQAIRNVDQAAVSVKALNEQHLAFEEKFVQKYQVEETSRIQKLYEDAMAASTQHIQKQVQKTTKVIVDAAAGTYKDVVSMEVVTEDVVPVNVANALQTQRVRLLQGMKENVIVMRSQQAQICSNAANAAAYLEALNAYFTQRQVSFESMMAAEQSMFSFLETFLSKEKK